MIKLLGCILIITATTCGGFHLAENLRKRVNQLKEIQRAVVQLESEITYTYSPLPEALLKVAFKSKDPLKDLFAGIADKLVSNYSDSVHDAFTLSLENYREKLSLSDNDIGILLDLSKGIGGSDLEGHKNVFALCKNDLAKEIEAAEAYMYRNTKMYRYLGFSFGAVIAILLI